MNPLSRINEIKSDIQTATSNTTANITRAWGHAVKFVTQNQAEPTQARTSSTFQTVAKRQRNESHPPTKLQGEKAASQKPKPLPKRPIGNQNAIASPGPKPLPERPIRNQNTVTLPQLKRLPERPTDSQNSVVSSGLKPSPKPIQAEQKPLESEADEITRMEKEIEDQMKAFTNLYLGNDHHVDLRNDHVVQEAIPPAIHKVSPKPLPHIPAASISKILMDLHISQPTSEDTSLLGDFNPDDAFGDFEFSAESEETMEDAHFAPDEDAKGTAVVSPKAFERNVMNEKEKTDFTNLKAKLGSISTHNKPKLRDIFNPAAGEKGIKTLNEVLDHITLFTKNGVIPAHEIRFLLATLENQDWTKSPLKDKSTETKLATIKKHLENKIEHGRLLAYHEERLTSYATLGGFSLREIEELEKQINKVQDALKTSSAYLNALK